MGIETALMIGMAAASAAGTAVSARNTAKSQVAQAEAEAEAKSKEIAQLASSQRSSFLKSGVGVGGSVSSVLNNTFIEGREDMSTILANGQAAADATSSSAMTQIASTLGGAAVSAYGGLEDMSGDISTADYSSGGIIKPSRKPVF